MTDLQRVAVREVSIPTTDGTINAWRFVDEAGDSTATRPAVIVLMDAPGIRPALHDVARAIAERGYLVLLPNLYYRIGRDIQVGPTRGHPDADRNRDQMVEHIQTLSNAMVVRDITAMLDHLQDDPAWDGRPIGLTGYCMSGRFAVLAAANMPDRVACAASYFGTRLITDQPDSPHMAVGSSTPELYFSFAEIDHYVPPEMIDRLSAHLTACGVKHQVEVYTGTEHGFVFPDRGSHHEDGARRHWQSLFDLFDRNLKNRT